MWTLRRSADPEWVPNRNSTREHSHSGGQRYKNFARADACAPLLTLALLLAVVSVTAWLLGLVLLSFRGILLVGLRIVHLPLVLLSAVLLPLAA